MGEHKQPAGVTQPKRSGGMGNEPLACVPTLGGRDSGEGKPEDRPDEGTELGAVRVHHGVIAVIARLAALKAPGVAGMSGSFTDGIASMIGKTAGDRGIKVKVEDQSVSVEMNIIIDYGVCIPDVALRVQHDVRRAIEDMTGKKVKAVDVVIQGVKCSSEKQQEGETP